MKTTEHYVITIDVKRSTHAVTVPAHRTALGTPAAEKAERVVEDVTHLVFRAGTLYEALDKAEAHLALMKPAGDQDEGPA